MSEHPSDQTIGGLGDKAAGMGDVPLSAGKACAGPGIVRAAARRDQT